MEIVTIISTVGFPIAMCIYLVTRFEKVLDNNTTAVAKLTEIVEQMYRGLK
jgi:hypothetical protein